MKERVKEFDLARGFAILCMILVHLMYAIYDYSNELFFCTVDFLGSPFAAPVFMFVMGANMKRCSHNKPGDFFKRGLGIFITSIIFNIICHSLPFFILGGINNTLEYNEVALHFIGAIDILTFAGLAFMFVGLLKKFKLNSKWIFIIAIILSIINQILYSNVPIDFNEHRLLATFSSWFYCSSITGYFSLFGWFIFPAAGMVYIDLVGKYRNSRKFHMISTVVGACVFFVMLFYSFRPEIGGPIIDFNDEFAYYKMPLYGSTMAISFVVAWIGVMYYLVRLMPEKLFIPFQKISKNLTNIYLSQWFIINYGFVLLFNNEFRTGPIGVMICFVIVLVISNFVGLLLKKYKEYKSN